ncbi:BTB/POZ domain-containing protein 9-like [Drosophila pseudoobscura]|uniref:BTB/POZ domain-containing protein 9-like n=1 Tax=Drosophila pseudoobscura pseudoobscura TaxID=46245 RepID=A0A6I8V8H8_DROPS|nr:BTB/POZ domain-containing protein 9 [Drosophila pseudoobscura]XP_015035375.2 BTB/POZ domain-containing protein 9 [Drosophila pseudoobscura]
MNRSALSSVPFDRNLGDILLALDLNSLFMNELYSDVAFIVEDQRLPAHRMILICRSQYFRELLSGGMCESDDQIRLEAPLEAFKVILRFLYTGTLPLSTLEVDEIFKVLGLANMYGLVEVEVNIDSHLQKNLAVSNVCTILDTARVFNLVELATKCLDFMCKKGYLLLEHDSFQTLSKELLEEVLQRDNFLAYEGNIFEAVCKWSRHNPCVDIKSVISLVRLPLISVRDLMRVVRPSGIFDPETILEAIDKALSPLDLEFRTGVCPGLALASNDWQTCCMVNNNETVIKMPFWCIINNILVESTQKNITLNCTVEISCDMTNWNGVGNIKLTASEPRQDIRFRSRRVRFIRIVHPISGRKDVLNEVVLKAIKNTNITI